MDPVCADMGGCAYDFEYVSVNEWEWACDCRYVYMHLCTYVTMNKFAIVVIHYGPFKK